ncbi:uncharacterized protein LOC107853346 [Capsicum annuum]|uniref:uncharacterized protein LOC107853346 n=1 Tax=Capsicum annuum TaxID=4072 RepID=UPI001FB104CD|nr:uncharacterized protein LOC107853346 [Capsicum annuum]
MVNPTAHETAAVATGSTKDATNSTLTNSIHSYYRHLSDSSRMILVNAVFDGKDYRGWRRAIRIALSAKNKLGFIDRSFAQPESSSLFQPWSRCNDMLQKELSGLVQENSDIPGYYTKVKRIWDELDALNTYVHFSCDCTCKGKSKNLKSLLDGHLIQFLMSLNDTYSSIRSNILMISPFPSVNQAYSLLIQDAKQHEIYASKYPIKPAFLATSMKRPMVVGRIQDGLYLVKSFPIKKRSVSKPIIQQVSQLSSSCIS